jgi:outer membrane protein assembly factor BamB
MMNMKQITMLLLCVGITFIGLPNWVCFKGSLERESSIDAPAPDTPYLLWKADLGSELHSSPLVKNGKVFQVALEELVCMNCDTGDMLWRSSVPAFYYTPALTDERIIVSTNRGVTALSIENGTFQWEYIVPEWLSRSEPVDYIVSSPGVFQGKVVVGTMPTVITVPHAGFHESNKSNLVCLDEITGKEEWSIGLSTGTLSSPCISHGKVYAASREMLCIDLEEGKILWNSEQKYPWNVEDPIKERYVFRHSTPAIYHGILVGGSCSTRLTGQKPRYTGWQKIVAIDQYTGDILWGWGEEGILYSSPAVQEGQIYFYSCDGIVRCLSLLDGRELWKTPISEPKELYLGGGLGAWPSPAVADKKVYIGSIEGVFCCLDADSGEILWKYETGGSIHSVPAIVPGKVLISSGDGTLYCFGIDPATYKTKAEQYLEDKEYQKAEEYLLKAKENAETSEETEEIDRLLDLVKKEMPEYNKKLEKLSEAESFMDEADKILWNKKFNEAKNLYTKAFEIYEEYNDEFGTSFCERRIDYINRRIAERTWIEMYWWQLIILGCFGAAFIFLFKKYRK